MQLRITATCSTTAAAVAASFLVSFVELPGNNRRIHLVLHIVHALQERRITAADHHKRLHEYTTIAAASIAATTTTAP
ncbi:hypothetical protein AYI69_g9160 [Smittium culicis]|uniref:Uncharacterized protein n=1 Tax=Smittium culicis TaxID=133412 RepID=A0A1R1XEK3_9FUNG|nr:hypothetical protein AYI69_g9160 [Smittium culicis]